MEGLVKKIEKAHRFIRPHCLETALIHSPHLSQLNKGKVYLKMESEQYTGSFKMRGAMNKILNLSPSERRSGVITASTGNHALGVARACQLTYTKGTIYLPVSASKSKIKSLAEYPVELSFHEGNSLETELTARQRAMELGTPWVSPYNDEDIIAGQGTIAAELSGQIDTMDAVFVTVGGGGLISGIGTYLKAVSPHIKIIACQPENSPEMKMSVEAGKITNLQESLFTLSDGSAGGIEENSITFSLCQKVIDEFVLVSEKEIRDCIRLIFREHHKVIEGSAAVAVASFIKKCVCFEGMEVVIVICGGNIGHKTFMEILVL